MDTCAFLDGIDFSASLDTVSDAYYNGNSVGRATALRIVLDRATSKVEARKLFGRSVEFPMIHPEWTGRQHTVGFGAGDDIDDPNHWTPPQVPEAPIQHHAPCVDVLTCTCWREVLFYLFPYSSMTMLGAKYQHCSVLSMYL